MLDKFSIINTAQRQTSLESCACTYRGQILQQHFNMNPDKPFQSSLSYTQLKYHKNEYRQNPGQIPLQNSTCYAQISGFCASKGQPQLQRSRQPIHTIPLPHLSGLVELPFITYSFSISWSHRKPAPRWSSHTHPALLASALLPLQRTALAMQALPPLLEATHHISKELFSL